jgi:hypothetical protein
LIDDIIERLDPFGGFLGIEVVGRFGFYLKHGINTKLALARVRQTRAG